MLKTATNICCNLLLYQLVNDALAPRRLIMNKGKTACEGDRVVTRLVDACNKMVIGIYTDDPEPFMGFNDYNKCS